MIVLIDNYDSFTWNLYHFLGDLGCNTEVYRNDKISVFDVIKLNPSQIVISPGPCDPSSAGISMDLVSAAIKNDTGKTTLMAAMALEPIHCPTKMVSIRILRDITKIPIEAGTDCLMSN